VVAKRIGAVLLAAGLVIGAILLRGALDGDDAEAGTDPSAPTTMAPPRAASDLVCITELAAVCRSVAAEIPGLTVRVQPAGTTLDALAAVDGADAPLWVTTQPFPAMLDELRRDDPLDVTIEPLAATPLAVATPTDRAETLTTGCAGSALWACIGAHAGGPWTDLGGDASFRTVRPSLGLVEREAVALSSFGAAVAGYAGTPTPDPAALTADPAFLGWLRRLSGTVDPATLSAGTPLATMATRAGSLDIAATTDAEVATVGSGRFGVQYPQPAMQVEAVLAVPAGAAAPDGLADALGTAAEAAGWAAPGTVTQPVPDARTMLALRTLWRDATG